MVGLASIGDLMTAAQGADQAASDTVTQGMQVVNQASTDQQSAAIDAQDKKNQADMLSAQVANQNSQAVTGIAKALGFDPADQSSSLWQAVQQQHDATASAMKAAQEIDQMKSVSFTDNPIQFLVNQVSVPFAQAAYNAHVASANTAEAAIAGMDSSIKEVAQGAQLSNTVDEVKKQTLMNAGSMYTVAANNAKIASSAAAMGMSASEQQATDAHRILQAAQTQFNLQIEQAKLPYFIQQGEAQQFYLQMAKEKYAQEKSDDAADAERAAGLNKILGTNIDPDPKRWTAPMKAAIQRLSNPAADPVQRMDDLKAIGASSVDTGRGVTIPTMNLFSLYDKMQQDFAAKFAATPGGWNPDKKPEQAALLNNGLRTFVQTQIDKTAIKPVLTELGISAPDSTLTDPNSPVGKLVQTMAASKPNAVLSSSDLLNRVLPAAMNDPKFDPAVAAQEVYDYVQSSAKVVNNNTGILGIVPDTKINTVIKGPQGANVPVNLNSKSSILDAINILGIRHKLHAAMGSENVVGFPNQ